MPTKFADSFEVFRWPEFLAFAKRLGIPLELPITDLGIVLRMDESVKVDLGFRSMDLENQPPVETTSLHNKEWSTFQPPTETSQSFAGVDAAVKMPWPTAADGSSLMATPEMLGEAEKKRGREFI